MEINIHAHSIPSRKGPNEHVRHCVHAAYWIRDPKGTGKGAIECINSWGDNQRFLGIPGTTYTRFDQAALLSLDRVHELPLVYLAWRPAVPTGLDGMLLQCNLYVKENGTVSGFCEGMASPQNTTLSTHKELLWKSTIAAMVQGNTHDLNEELAPPAKFMYMGIKSKEGFNWVDGGTITTNNSTIYHNGWLLDQCVSSHKLLHWTSTMEAVRLGEEVLIKGERGCKLVALSYKAGKAPSIKIIIMRVRHTNKDNGTWVPPREELPALDVEPDVAAARDNPLLPDLLDVDQRAERGREQPCGRRRGRDCGGGPACQCNEL
ncbi:hypothetical protein Pelo_18857 [Pelomyxa schiedti]|nr:hypothetical protein Pelo_18857 [Pelomyxa schiedti]